MEREGEIMKLIINEDGIDICSSVTVQHPMKHWE